MTAQSAPLIFSTVVLRCTRNACLWTLKTTQHTLAGGIQYIEYRYPTRAEAVTEAIRLAFDYKQAVAAWEFTQQQAVRADELPACYHARLTAEAQATATDYLAQNPLLHAELNALFGNWQNEC